MTHWEWRELKTIYFAALSIPASSVYLGASAGSVDSATVSILDNDNVTVQFSMSEYEVSEDAGEVTLYISSDIQWIQLPLVPVYM